ncbi:hypothetical protein IV203_016698 [Nitzschia inconspicua]|uniref:Uncharacterized protein n=1 Tax=Nitzschia inconspicua TaxID=303405 RepID=A0A9K3KQ87_9STRA|nr:hypothetical protein IV203_016698 [Nitzschia inconspicua]
MSSGWSANGFLMGSPPAFDEIVWVWNGIVHVILVETSIGLAQGIDGLKSFHHPVQPDSLLEDLVSFLFGICHHAICTVENTSVARDKKVAICGKGGEETDPAAHGRCPRGNDSERPECHFVAYGYPTGVYTLIEETRNL